MRESSTTKRGKSTSDNRKLTRSPVRPDELARVTAGYRDWLARQPLSVNTRRTYLGRVRQYCAYLETSAGDYGDPLSDPHARDYRFNVEGEFHRIDNSNAQYLKPNGRNRSASLDRNFQKRSMFE
jgi:hypothetical protein